ncbi:hypothetical protein cce_2263 [Crocosphaera subtropica ATCC 51142]|uniref:Membrane-associated oxidoreductase n=1 Tax=Crocosphaera subtropica (strain ATCC 51142 / BH68) TaxID=43989 RepID=B1WPP3_CROS5|nr:hypothetical protein [Crocosphaera subtropica]ACB51613.1 hypothetical protein cce_2263 [Crocosphaera subtropica ATCC 51142]
MATKAEQLIKLAEDFAKEKGFDLSETEKKLLTSVAEGKEADYRSTDETENDSEKGNTWDKSRSPKINILIWLCTDKEAISYLTHRGISISGAKIEGCLDLDFIDLDVPLTFYSCYFSEGIRLLYAKVKLLYFSACYIASNQNALIADNAEIKGNVLLNNGFQAKGKVVFSAATIGRTFILFKVKNSQEMTLFLSFAKINCLLAQEDSWPEKNKLYLEGLVYNSIDNDSSVDSQSRLKWIRLQNLEDNFSPQTYEQLAKVLRMSGHEEAATEILIAKQNDRRRYGELKGFSWGWNFILGFTIDHGYRTQKILVFVLFFIGIGWGIFFWGESQNLMSPSRIIALVNPSSTQKIIDPNYPKFNALMYSVDSFVPIIDFYQESYWLPNANITTDLEIPLNYSNKITWKNANIGSLLRCYFWFHIFMGWVLTSLGVAGFTGLVRRLG